MRRSRPPASHRPTTAPSRYPSPSPTPRLPPPSYRPPAPRPRPPPAPTATRRRSTAIRRRRRPRTRQSRRRPPSRPGASRSSLNRCGRQVTFQRSSVSYLVLPLTNPLPLLKFPISLLKYSFDKFGTPCCRLFAQCYPEFFKGQETLLLFPITLSYPLPLPLAPTYPRGVCSP